MRTSPFLLLFSACGALQPLSPTTTDEPQKGDPAASTPAAIEMPPTQPSEPAMPPADPGTVPPVDPPADPPVPAACPTGALLCDSFEQGLSSAVWKVRGSSATFSVDTTTPAADGASSLHMAYGKPYGHTGEQAVEPITPPVAPNDRIYLRVYLRFGNLALPGAHPAFIFVADKNADNEVGFGSISNDFAMMGWGNYSGGLDNARAWYEGGNWHPGIEDGDKTPLTEQNLAAEKWICVEAMFFGDHQAAGDTSHPNEEVAVWIDGVSRPELGLSDALWKQELGKNPPEHWSPSYASARWMFGVESFGPQNVALDIWFDALVFSPNRIGCLP